KPSSWFLELQHQSSLQQPVGLDDSAQTGCTAAQHGTSFCSASDRDCATSQHTQHYLNDTSCSGWFPHAHDQFLSGAMASCHHHKPLHESAGPWCLDEHPPYKQQPPDEPSLG